MPAVQHHTQVDRAQRATKPKRLGSLTPYLLEVGWRDAVTPTLNIPW